MCFALLLRDLFLSVYVQPRLRQTICGSTTRTCQDAPRWFPEAAVPHRRRSGKVSRSTTAAVLRREHGKAVRTRFVIVYFEPS